MANDVEMMVKVLLQLKKTNSASCGLKSELFARFSMSAQCGVEPVKRILYTLSYVWMKKFPTNRHNIGDVIACEIWMKIYISFRICVGDVFVQK